MRITRRGWLGALLAGALGAAVGLGAPAGAQAQDITVFAAASLKDALDAINTQWQADAKHKATISYAASSALAKQIEAGAPADVFISADLDWMKYLADRKLIKPETQATLLGNRIVLVAPKDSTVQLTIAPNFELAKALGDGHLAMADVKAVPAGKYGQAALETLGVWASVKDKVAQAENVRATLALVSRGEAPLGIVYQTDAAAESGGQGRRHLPGRQPPADPVPGGGAGQQRQARGPGLRRLPEIGPPPSRCSRSRVLRW